MSTDPKRHEVPIHRGLVLVAELRPARSTRFTESPMDVYVGVRDEPKTGEDQIAYVEAGPDLRVVRAMRDALNVLLGEAAG